MNHINSLPRCMRKIMIMQLPAKTRIRTTVFTLLAALLIDMCHIPVALSSPNDNNDVDLFLIPSYYPHPDLFLPSNPAPYISPNSKNALGGPFINFITPDNIDCGIGKDLFCIGYLPGQNSSSPKKCQEVRAGNSIYKSTRVDIPDYNCHHPYNPIVLPEGHKIGKDTQTCLIGPHFIACATVDREYVIRDQNLKIAIVGRGFVIGDQDVKIF